MSVHCKVLEDWAPDFSKNGNNWLIGNTDLREMFASLRKERNINVSLEEYRKFEFEFLNQMFDPRTGEFYSLDKYLKQRSKKGLNNDVRKAWHFHVEKRRKNGQRSLIEACTILRNRLLKNELDKSPVSNNEWPGWSLELFENTPSEDDILSHIKVQFQKGYYDTLMVDEVQDLPSIAVNMLSFMCPNRAISDNYTRFIIAGDHLQTINGQKFVWSNFLKELTDLTQTIAKQHKHIFVDNETGFPSYHHLKGLCWDKNQVDQNVKENHLTVNYRNHKNIVDFTKHDWGKWPNEKYTSDSKNVDIDSQKLEEMAPYRIGNLSETRVLYIETENSKDYKNRLTEMLEFLNGKAKLALLFNNEWIKSFADTIIEESRDTRGVELFNPG